MKTALFILGQFLLFAIFVALFFCGSFLGLFHLDPLQLKWFVSHPGPFSVRYFIPTGLILMTLFYLIVLAIEAATKRLRTAGVWTSVAFVIALILGIAAKFGWVQPS